jgi:amino acid permease
MNDQHELYENARTRVKQKKQLYFHFVFFLIGSVFLIILNKILKIGENFIENWFVWAILLWLFLLVLHFINVHVTNRFMGKDWERKQTEILVLKQEQRILKLEKEIVKEAKLKAESEQYAAELKKKDESQNNTTEE